ncbi:hypothetical protein RCL1_007718 [Eukaryota sp. TZLM3-RCL]
MPISSEFCECSLCFNVFNNPVVLPCGHTFCSLPASHAGESASVAQIKPNYQLRSLIDDLASRKSPSAVLVEKMKEMEIELKRSKYLLEVQSLRVAQAEALRIKAEQKLDTVRKSTELIPSSRPLAIPPSKALIQPMFIPQSIRGDSLRIKEDGKVIQLCENGSPRDHFAAADYPHDVLNVYFKLLNKDNGSVGTVIGFGHFESGTLIEGLHITSQGCFK